MVKRRGPPSQGWRTFLRNHAPDIAAMDLFVAPTIGFAERLIGSIRRECFIVLDEAKDARAFDEMRKARSDPGLSVCDNIHGLLQR